MLLIATKIVITAFCVHVVLTDKPMSVVFVDTVFLEVNEVRFCISLEEFVLEFQVFDIRQFFRRLTRHVRLQLRFGVQGVFAAFRNPVDGSHGCDFVYTNENGLPSFIITFAGQTL